jgi:hypothetical protein
LFLEQQEETEFLQASQELQSQEVAVVAVVATLLLVVLLLLVAGQVETTLLVVLEPQIQVVAVAVVVSDPT